jgi:hypothetical protein
MTANEIMNYVRKWHEEIGDMPSKQAGPKVRQIYREMQRAIAKHIDSPRNLAQSTPRTG